MATYNTCKTVIKNARKIIIQKITIMKLLKFLIVLAIIIHSTVFSQGCLPEGIEFLEQSQIDDFQTNYPGCTKIEGNVLIMGENITDLSGINVINTIDSNLLIWDCIRLKNLSGLENLDTIHNRLSIHANDSLKDLEGLNGLKFIGEDLWIFTHYELSSLNGLNQLDSIGGGLHIALNDSLTNLNALSGLTKINGMLDFNMNYILADLSGLDNILPSSITDLTIKYNPLLTFCEVQSICDYLASPGGEFTIEFNSTGCNSKEEVEEACLTNVSEPTETNDHITIYPNPANRDFGIKNKIRDEISEVTIINHLGIIVHYEKHFNHKVDVSTLPQGMYIVEIVSDGLKYRKKLIIE